jgi:hypothetical protein
LFVVLLSIDRYVVMCLPDHHRRKRSYKNASMLSIMALFIAIVASFPLFIFSEMISQNGYTKNFVLLENAKKFCIVKWPTVKAAQMLVIFSITLKQRVVPRGLVRQGLKRRYLKDSHLPALENFLLTGATKPRKY